jgi:two-component system phosphate regulon sensor histidine kinase PhoR
MKWLWNRSLAAKVFLSYFSIVCLLFAGFYFFSESLIRRFHIANLSTRMEQEAQLLGRILPWDREGASLDEFCRDLARALGSRITVIALDGKVLGDSAENSTTMENHANRPEVIEASRSGMGTSVRFSTTVHHNLLYGAFRQNLDGQMRIVRVATPLEEVDSVVAAVRRSLLIGLMLASAAGLVLAVFFARALTRRINRLVQFSGHVARGSFPQNFFTTKRNDEISLLEHHLNEMSAKIRDNLAHVTGEREKADSILRCMIEGVLVLDSRGRVLVINDQAKAMFQLPEQQEVHGASFVDISRHPELRLLFDELCAHDFAEAVYAKEIELEADRWFRVNAAVLRDGAGAARGTILVFHDISQIKRYERIRSDFVANVSHELRTPLTAIRGYAETLLYAPPADPADSRRFLEIIDRHSERLTRLTEDLLVLSDLQSGRALGTLQAVDTGQLVQRVLEIFWERASNKGVRLTQTVSRDLPPVAGDPDRLQQLLINLVDNAVKYTPAGGRVTVNATGPSCDAAGNGYLELAVSDTGVGIPENDLPRLTERFYRVDKARSRELGGTGLGLAIVKHIVQAHHGELKITSEINQGTTVSARLPLATNGNSESSLHVH